MSSTNVQSENVPLPQEPTKFVLYLRISTGKSGGVDSNGIAAQERDLNIFLSTQHQPEVIGTFIDVMSGAKDERPELENALQLCRKTGAHLAIQKVDRLSRDVAFVATLLKDKRITLRVANLPNANNFQIHLFAAIGEQEREFISMRTKAALREWKVRNPHKTLGNPKLYELNQHKKRRTTKFDLRISPMIRTLRGEGMSYRRIAMTLNNMGEKTPKGCDYYPQQVRRIYQRNHSQVAA